MLYIFLQQFQFSDVSFMPLLQKNKPQTREAVVRKCSVKKMFSEISQNSQENICARVSFLIKLQALGNFIKKMTLAQVFSCEFCKISKSTFFTEHLQATASVLFKVMLTFCLKMIIYQITVDEIEIRKKCSVFFHLNKISPQSKRLVFSFSIQWSTYNTNLRNDRVN